MTDEKLTYEQARTELAGVVEKLEAGGTSLEVYGVGLVRVYRVNGMSHATPVDPGNFFDPVRVVVSGNQTAPLIDVSAANSVATVSTGHLNDTGTHSYSLFFRVRANVKRPVKAQLTAGPKIAPTRPVPRFCM